jgi:acyl-coenzyme A synthetase/AMP-(fatty) acid ligase
VVLARERSDPDTLRWCENNLGVPAIDHWWQMELAYPGTGNSCIHPTIIIFILKIIVTVY